MTSSLLKSLCRLYNTLVKLPRNTKVVVCKPDATTLKDARNVASLLMNASGPISWLGMSISLFTSNSSNLYSPSHTGSFTLRVGSRLRSASPVSLSLGYLRMGFQIRSIPSQYSYQTNRENA